MMMYSEADMGSWVTSGVWMLFHLTFLTVAIAIVFASLKAMTQRNSYSKPETRQLYVARPDCGNSLPDKGIDRRWK